MHWTRGTEAEKISHRLDSASEACLPALRLPTAMRSGARVESKPDAAQRSPLRHTAAPICIGDVVLLDQAASAHRVALRAT